MTTGVSKRVDQYLARHAEREAEIAAAIGAVYARAVVLPVCRETPEAIAGCFPAARAASGRTLGIVVVNGTTSAGEETHHANAGFLDACVRGFGGATRIWGEPPVWQVSLRDLDLVVVDRASPGCRFPHHEGVGLARRIGTDLALALYRLGRIESPWIFQTDADAVLPAGHFERAECSSWAAIAGACVAPFWHETHGDAALAHAIHVYETWLRYYVLGLSWAGSPYATHTLGSTLAVRAEAYAAVRGFPRRQAAEDFYLLDKLSKVQPVARLDGLPVRLRARRSDRAPFGTGAGIARLEAAPAAPLFLHPEAFAVLRVWLRGLDAFARSRRFVALDAELGVLDRRSRAVLEGVLSFMRAREALLAASGRAQASAVLRRRLHTWFGALRTLRLMHALRDAAFGAMPWETAIARAPFCADADPAEGLEAVRARLRAVEGLESRLVGPAAPQDGSGARS